jgi:hypothetical protein
VSFRSLVFAASAASLTWLASGDALADEPPPPSPPPQVVRRIPLPDQHFEYSEITPVLSPLWVLAQLVPSPEIAVGSQRHIDASGHVDEGPRATWGLRWQLTPVLWSWGVHRSQSRWRWFIVDPLARHSGSIEASTAFEYIGGDIDRVLVRPGVRAYLPIAQKGESLSVSIGETVYAFDYGLRVGHEVGLYTLSGLVGLQVTIAPTHAPIQTIATLRLRYF